MLENLSDKYRHIPRDDTEIAKLSFELPYLKPNVSWTCGRTIWSIKRYMEMEGACDNRKLKFLRTAVIEGVKYWLWENRDTDLVWYEYIYVEKFEDTNVLGSQSGDGLSPEQFLMSEFLRNQVYWKEDQEMFNRMREDREYSKKSGEQPSL